ncbi:MAG: hypothetical protein AUG51_03445 [Acidobacteria bacterium 13_1_20CM_3_53_8]|nr:MAG: hypothetical protein AUG51_03445 [Acidobacteria bacterium 13_1_20CM_3_53_8]
MGAIFLILLFGIVSATPAQSVGQITEISLSRTACFGRCPVYEVILRADGTATYIGRRFAPRTGTYRGKISNRGFNKLAKLLTARNFFNFEDHYAVRATDLPSATTSALRDGVRKSVQDYGPGFEEDMRRNGQPTEREHAPAGLLEIERAIDAVAARIKWVKVSDDTTAPSHE